MTGGAHDIIADHPGSHGAVTLDCRCGRTFTGRTREKASDAHGQHYGLEAARTALGLEPDATRKGPPT